jgi:multiple sugar transport system permease protein
MTSTTNLDISAGLAAAETAPPERGRRGGVFGRAQAASGALFMAPNLVLVAIFLIVPLVLTVVYSLQKIGVLGSSQWLGINNYSDLFQDSSFWQSLQNTVVFTVVTVPISMGLGLALATLLNGFLPGRAIYRSIIFLPLVISGVATGVIGQFLFDENNGFVNKLLASMGFTGPHWQSDGFWAMVSIMIVTVWQRVGFAMIIYLAGLQGVDPALLEAATVDGASTWQRFRRITFPLLGPSTFFLLIMNIIYSFQVFDTVWAMTRGGPGFSTTTLVTLAYRTAFDDHGPQELGYGAAIGIVIYIITLVITIVQWKASRNRDEAG